MHLKHYYGSIKALLMLYECSIKALLRLYECSIKGSMKGSMKALIRALSNKGSIKAQHSLGNGVMDQARLSMNIRGSMMALMT
jgi:hypothetical protein